LEVLEERSLLNASPSTASVAAAYGQLPLAFEVNEGQAAAGVNYVAHGSGYTLDLSSQQAVLNLSGQSTSSTSQAANTTLTMQLASGRTTAPAVGSDELITKSNYLIGPNPSQWLTNIANYGAVTYQGVYQGTDVTYHGNQGRLEYDFTLHPGASVGAIQLSFQGQQGLSLDGKGNLVIQTTAGPLLEQAPVAYQVNADGSHTAVSSQFVLEGNGQVGFQVGAYDLTKTLVIDPTLTYSSYLPAPGQGIAVDSAGDAFVTGVGPFVDEVNPTGTALLYSTTLGSGGAGLGIAVDGAGDAYVTGVAGSGLPTTANAAFPTTSATHNAFLSVLNPTGSGLLYSTYLPNGGDNLFGRSGAIALDSSGNAYVTGGAAAGFPTTPNAYQTAAVGPTNAFLTEINPNLSGSASLLYSTYLGGSSYDWGTGVAVDGSGNAYVTGGTESSNFPTTAGAFQRTYINAPSGTGNGGFGVGDVFVAKFNPSLSGSASLVYSTYLGGGDGYVSPIGPTSVVLNWSGEKGSAIAVDASGDAYIAGTTNYSSFPTTPGAFQTTYHTGTPGTKKHPGTPASAAEPFVTKLNPTGSGLVYSTFLGGSTMDGAKGIALDAQDNAYVTGYTRSTDFPTLNPLQSQKASGTDGWGNTNSDAFVTTLNAAGSALLFSTYLGGSGDDYGQAIAVNSAGDAYVAGGTSNPSSTNFPTTPGAFQTTPGSGFVFMIDPPVSRPSTAVPQSSGAGTPAASPASPLPPGLPAPQGAAQGVSGPAGTTALDGLFAAYLDGWLLQAFDRLLADLQAG
jgi:hypothetical protein